MAYSDRRLLTGFEIAARIAWKLMVTIVISKAPAPTAKKIHALSSVW